MTSCFRAFLFSAILASSCLAQFEQGAIVGQVNDPQDAPIAGATVQIRSSTTNVSREVTTSASGEYNSLPLPPGVYTVTVRQQGFRDKAIEVTLGVSQRLQADFALELGTVSEQVIVEARAAALETESSDIGQVKAGKGDRRPAVEHPELHATRASCAGRTDRCWRSFGSARVYQRPRHQRRGDQRRARGGRYISDRWNQQRGYRCRRADLLSARRFNL